jgi:3-isopropylmalate/(R)-2-methylmalate dehydratase small subunit
MIVGRAWVFGDHIDTDVLAPGAYMKRSMEELANHCLEAINPHFAAQVQPGDIVVAGVGFGIGSSREQAAQALKLLGVGCVIAQSFARIFYRNAINLGLPVLVCEAKAIAESGHSLAVDLIHASIRNTSTGRLFSAEAMPEFLQLIVQDGGLMPHLKRKLRS